MIIRDFNHINKNDKRRVVSDANWKSIRMLLAEDGMGFSFHITILNEGSRITINQIKHLLK